MLLFSRSSLVKEIGFLLGGATIPIIIVTFIGKTNHAVNTYRSTQASFVSWTLDISSNVPEMMC